MREAGRGTRPAGWLGAAIQAGHAAKGTIYAATAALALWRAVSGVGGAGGAREAVRAIAGAPFGQAAIGILAVGLAAYALSRLTLALLDPENAGWRRRALHLVGAAFNAALVVFLVHLLMEASPPPPRDRPGSRRFSRGRAAAGSWPPVERFSRSRHSAARPSAP